MNNIGLAYGKHSCWCNITNHAVEQYIARWAPDKNYEEACSELFSLLGTSAPNGKTILGDTIYVSGHRPSIRMVVKDRNVCVTVLPANSNDQDIIDEFDQFNSFLEEEKSKIDNEIFHLSQEKEKLELSKKELNSRIHAINNRVYILKSKLQKITTG